jgi:hypothetical protein
MKAESKKSKLGRESLKTLTTDQLAAVAGGAREGWGDGTPDGPPQF